MSKEIYGHVSKKNISGIHKTSTKGISLCSVIKYKTVFVDQFEIDGYIFQISHNPYNGKWEVTEKFTGLSACQHESAKTWGSREKAVTRALENINKYRADGSLQRRLKTAYEDWLHTRTSMDNMSAIKLKILKKL